MKGRSLPHSFEISPEVVKNLAETYGTPFWLYHAPTIRSRISRLKSFDTIRYAQKANNNMNILDLMRQNDVVVDAVTAGEIYFALKAGYRGGPREKGLCEIVYTADIFDQDAKGLIAREKLAVNCGSIDMLSELATFAPNAPLMLRINPGFGHGHSKKTNTGGLFSKHGIWHEDLPECIELIKRLRLNFHGLHLHIGSGVDFDHLTQVIGAMKECAKRCPLPIKTLSVGGGLSIPYTKEDRELDTVKFASMWKEAHEAISRAHGHPIPNLEVEPGRFLVAESGILVTRIRSIKSNGSIKSKERVNYYLVDAGFDTLMRPVLYGSYHEISLIRTNPSNFINDQQLTVVAGPLCESGDVFTQNSSGEVTPRLLPMAAVGDFLIIHDAGAYGASMSSNYNGRLKAAEFIVDNQENLPRLIRRRESAEDLVATQVYFT
jgi:diaminopimelate decarboxylase